MNPAKLDDLQAFVAVAREQSFTKAAARIGVTPSALSHTMRALEARLGVVGSPAYFERHRAPLTPHDLTAHACVNIRHRPSGAIYAWEFEKDGKIFTVRTEGQLVFNSTMHVLNGAVDGIGLAYVPEKL